MGIPLIKNHLIWDDPPAGWCLLPMTSPRFLGEQFEAGLHHGAKRIQKRLSLEKVMI